MIHQLSPAARFAAIEQAAASARSSGGTATAHVVGGGLLVACGARTVYALEVLGSRVSDCPFLIVLLLCFRIVLFGV
jgi:hypothetical protein